MKKAFYQISVIIGIGLTFISCNKDTVPNVDENNASANTEVYAGIYDSTFSYQELGTPLEINMSWDAQNLYGVGNDSLDIDADGSYDLRFTLNLLNEDSLHLVSGFPNPFPSCFVTSSNGYEVASYEEVFYIGLGQTSTATFADRLDLNERLDLLPEWETNLKMWGENPGGAGTPPFGDWYSATSQNYLAIRLNDDKFGWLEVDASNAKNPKFISFAIQN